MDLDQVVKRLEWLDDERRKDKLTIATLEERLVLLEGNLPAIQVELKEISAEVSRLSMMVARFDQLDTALAQLRVDLSRAIEVEEKARLEQQREMDKIRRADLESLTRSVGDVRKGLEPIPDLKKGLQLRMDEDFRLSRLIEEVEQKIQENQRHDEEYRRAQKLMEEGRRQDAKRLTDLQSEVAAFRKRLDEQRGKVDINVDSTRKLELRITEMQNAESERRQAQTAFIDRQNLALVERERVWKEWQASFEDIIGKAVNLETQLQALDVTHRAVKRSQEAFDDITQRFDRRVNEITEMQRLVEERFRQEWVSFKADDQKRWTNYSLTQDELQREQNRQLEKLVERLVNLEDITQDLRDFFHQQDEDIHKRLQDLLALSRSWIEQYERISSRSR